MADHKIPSYVVGHTGGTDTEEGFQRFVRNELTKIQETLGSIVSGVSQVLYQAPSKPREGQLVYAKSPWNPGSGDGLYVYKSGGWTFIV